MATVLHVTQPTDAGVGAYVASLCADQAGRGWDVVLACPDRGALVAEAGRWGVRHEDWAAGRGPDARTPRETWHLGRLLDRVGPDVVHLHSAKAGLAGRLAVRGCLPTLFQPHGWSWLAARPGTVAATSSWERLAARWTARFVLAGAGEVRHASDRGLCGCYSVVRTGIDLERFQPAGGRDRALARERLRLARAPLAVCVGRVTRQKGQDVLLRAWRRVREHRPGAQLAIVGDGDQVEALRQGAPPGVVFAGRVDDPRPWYAAADVVVLPSRWEGVPLTLLEALATGRPVVGTDVPGIAEELPSGAGCLVPAGDVAALAAAVDLRLGQPETARAEGAAAARYAAERADIRHTHDRLAAVTALVAGWSR